MEILNISLNKYTLICPSCCQLARIKIYPEKRQIKSKCIDGHKHKNISYISIIILYAKSIMKNMNYFV